MSEFEDGVQTAKDVAEKLEVSRRCSANQEDSGKERTGRLRQLGRFAPRILSLLLGSRQRLRHPLLIPVSLQNSTIITPRQQRSRSVNSKTSKVSRKVAPFGESIYHARPVERCLLVEPAFYSRFYRLTHLPDLSPPIMLFPQVQDFISNRLSASAWTLRRSWRPPDLNGTSFDGPITASMDSSTAHSSSSSSTASAALPTASTSLGAGSDEPPDHTRPDIHPTITAHSIWDASDVPRTAGDGLAIAPHVPPANPEARTGWMLETKSSDRFPPAWKPTFPLQTLRSPLLATASSGTDDFVRSSKHASVDLHEPLPADLRPLPPFPRGRRLKDDDVVPCCACAGSSPQQLSLADFRRAEGPVVRAQKLHALWKSLPTLPAPATGPTPTSLARLPGQGTIGILSPERVERLERLYEEELVRRVTLEGRPEARLWGGEDDLSEPASAPSTSAAGALNGGGKGIAWKDFRRFLWDQERELWNIFHELDRDGDGRLNEADMKSALSRNGIEMTDSTLRDFVTFLASGSPPSQVDAQDHKDKTYITFAEFRDFLMLLPRKASVPEIYKFYQVRKRFHDGRGAARVNMDGDVSASFPKFTGPVSGSAGANKEAGARKGAGQVAESEPEEDESGAGKYVAWKFLLAGGVAGAGEL